MALDVEFTHLALLPGGRHVGLAAEVCAVDAEGRTLLYEFCNPLGECGRGEWRREEGKGALGWLGGAAAAMYCMHSFFQY